MKNILLIDTSDNKKISVTLNINDKLFSVTSDPTKLKSQIVLTLIDKLLKDHNLRLEDITAVEVNLISGSFTGVRVGASIANALGFALKIPINGKKVGDFVEPLYNDLI